MLTAAGLGGGILSPTLAVIDTVTVVGVNDDDDVDDDLSFSRLS